MGLRMFQLVLVVGEDSLEGMSFCGGYWAKNHVLLVQAFFVIGILVMD